MSHRRSTFKELRGFAGWRLALIDACKVSHIISTHWNLSRKEPDRCLGMMWHVTILISPLCFYSIEHSCNIVLFQMISDKNLLTNKELNIWSFSFIRPRKKKPCSTGEEIPKSNQSVGTICKIFFLHFVAKINRKKSLEITIFSCSHHS